jgi:pyruvate,water dikinase
MVDMGDPAGKLVYFFGAGQAEGGAALRELLGGKGASLADMTVAGLNVPPGFTISAECCARYHESGKRWPAGLEEQVRAQLHRLEQLVQRPFGWGGNPLLVAVRSGAAQSMPGMMDTILNVGLNPECVRQMGDRTGNHRAAWDAYRHFLEMFGHTALGLDESVFGGLISQLLRRESKDSEEQLDSAALEQLCRLFLETIEKHTGHPFAVDPWAMLVQAIDAVFESWHTERAVTYRNHHRIQGLLGTAVNVQMMCPSEVSGVMFTANPVNAGLEQIIVESSYGLGEAIVLGKVTPDRFVVRRTDLGILERSISVKHKVIATLAQDGRGQAGAKDSASLSDPQVEELARLGLRVEEYFQVPCDIEWGLSQGQFHLLQSRPIRGLDRPAAAAIPTEMREKVRSEEIAAAAARSGPHGTVWSRFNLAEILPEPTPMTWAIVRRFMSGKGGFGLMYRDLGFDPDPALDDEGIFDLICGRPYCNLSREARMHYRHLPFEHDFSDLKATPSRALYPQPRINPWHAGWQFWLWLPIRMPWVIFRMSRAERRRQKLAQTFAAEFRTKTIPAFEEEVQREMRQDLARIQPAALLDRLEFWIQRTLYCFARESLKPTALAGFAMGAIEGTLNARLGPERTQSALRELVMGVRPEPESNVVGAIRDLAKGKLDRSTFLHRFGHRGNQEMELQSPRWSEQPEALDQVAAHDETPAKQCSVAAAWQRVVAEARLTPAEQLDVYEQLQKLHTFMALRETAKHYLMKGYAQIRRILVELDGRFGLNGGIFFLTPEDLPRLLMKEDLSAVIDKARQRRAAALSLEAPQVLFSDDLEAIGRPLAAAGSDVLQGIALSAGVVEAPALVLDAPDRSVLPAEPYILVCPSTDPAWVPLFVQACGLVMETGGVLSHGAIVARDFGLPAVAGLPDIHRRLRTGQRLRVDGGSGTVTVLAP